METCKNINNKRLFLGAMVFISIASICFYIMISPVMPKYTIHSTDLNELDAMDLSKEVICLTSSNMEGYQGKLYTSKDFEKGIVVSQDSYEKYRTYRVVLHLEAGVTYGITGESASYAQRVFIDGTLLDETGIVSDQSSSFVPKTNRFTLYFTPEKDTTEIIIQHAWFNHRTGAIHKLYLAKQPLITQINRSQTLCDGLYSGMLLAMGLFFLGMFLVNFKNSAMLWFSLSCLSAMINYLIYESKQIMTLFPNLNWYLGHKIEHLSNIGYFFFVTLFGYTFLKCQPNKWIKNIYFSLITILCLFYVIAPSVVYVNYTVTLGAFKLFCELIVIIYLIFLEFQQHRLIYLKDRIICFSMVLVFGENLIESITYFDHILYLRTYFQIVLALLCAVVLMLDHLRMEHTLDEAKFKERMAVEKNEELEKMNDMKTEIMRNIAHELKTPLAVMSGYAQLTDKQIKKNMVDEETSLNLAIIVKETNRLSQMVTGLLNMNYGQKKSLDTSLFLPIDILEDAAAVCRPILLKRKNQLRIICETENLIKANREALLEVLINISVNAGKHTTSGIITYCVKEDIQTKMAIFTISDTGEGIRENDLIHVFERGYSTDGGNGLGLPICKEIIESIGGSIFIQNTGTEGTTICFTVPIIEKETL